jgi:hypothetical protein
MLRGLTLLGMAVALAACASSGPAVETKGGASVNTYPDNYRTEVLAYLASYLNDVSSIRNAGISVPAIRRVDIGERYVSCVRFSARTPGASATGRDYLAIFLAGKLDTMGATREQCSGATYEPFPELERLKR